MKRARKIVALPTGEHLDATDPPVRRGELATYRPPKHEDPRARRSLIEFLAGLPDEPPAE